MSEEKKPNREQNRREFMGTTLTGALMLAGYSCFGLKDAVAQARKTGKPVFSVETLNALFPSTPNAQHTQLLMEAQSDPRAFVRNHFTLTPAQEKDLNALTPQDLQSIKLALSTAQRENLRVVSDCGAGRNLKPGEQQVAQTSSLNFTKFVIQGGTTASQPQTRPGQQKQQPAPQTRSQAAPAQTISGNQFGGTLHLTISGFGR